MGVDRVLEYRYLQEIKAITVDPPKFSRDNSDTVLVRL